MRHRVKEHPSSNKHHQIQNKVDINQTLTTGTKHIRVAFIFIYKAKLKKKFNKS